MTRKQIFSWFFIGIFLLLIYLFYQIFKPFILSIFWSAILVLALHPLYERLTKFLKNKAGISSLIMTILAIFVIVIPLGLIITTLAIEIVNIFQEIKENVEGESLGFIVKHLEEYLPTSIASEIDKRFDINELSSGEVLSERAGAISSYLFYQIQTVIGNLTNFIINLGIMIFALFFVQRWKEVF